jgi:hypothetical protein
MLKVKELIEKLQAIENQDQEVKIAVENGNYIISDNIINMDNTVYIIQEL